MDRRKLEAGIDLILDGLGVDRSDHNFTETPARFARAMEELFAQHNGLPTAFEEQYTDFILVRGHDMWTLCPHHLLPVRMRVSIAYVPDGKVLGLSKLVRVMQQANTGPIMQERFTNEVRSKLEKALETFVEGEPALDISHEYHPNQKGICVLVEGWHGCMQMRGVKSDASTITMAYSGVFEKDQKSMERFMLLARGTR